MEHGPQEPPETPSKPDKSPKSDETPWTIAKRKPVSREVSDENENGGPSNWKDDGDIFEVGGQGDESPSRKPAKRTRFSTPGGQAVSASLKEGVLPTPDSGDKGKGKAIEAPFQTENISPIPNPADDMIPTPGGQTFDERLREAGLPIPKPGNMMKGKPMGLVPMQAKQDYLTPGPSMIAANHGHAGMANLTTRVVRLLRDEKYPLKVSTELQIRHEIDLELDLYAAKVRRYEETIYKQSKKIDELETLASHLTGIGSGDGSINDPIEL